jgi:NDP-sugar pyrophosphorylase family protein
MNIRSDIPLQYETSKFFSPISGYRKKEQTVMGDGCDIGDKVTMKQSVVGNNCKIGARSKLNNCVLMSGVLIGERYVCLASRQVMFKLVCVCI